MSIPLIINGVTFNFPSPFDTNWAPAVDAWATAVSNGLLQKSGGSFPLTAEVDFGGSFGLRCLYMKSEESNIASTGFFRLSNSSPGVAWRNFNNNGDLLLTVNSSDEITFNGVPFGTPASLTHNEIFVGNVSNQPTPVPLSGDATIIDTGALTIANGAITDAKVNGSAGIAVTKLAALSINKAVATDGSGFITPSATTDTELGYVSGVTSSIQTQIANAVAATAPSGAILMWPNNMPPTGWLLFDGSTYAQAVSPTLYTLYSGMAGFFTLPDMANFVPIGAGSIAAALASAGSATVTVIQNAHTHTIAHQHDTNAGHTTTSNIFMGSSPFGTSSRTELTEAATVASATVSTNAFDKTSDTLTADSGSSTATNQASSVVQPSFGLYFITKT